MCYQRCHGQSVDHPRTGPPEHAVQLPWIIQPMERFTTTKSKTQRRFLSTAPTTKVALRPKTDARLSRTHVPLSDESSSPFLVLLLMQYPRWMDPSRDLDRHPSNRFGVYRALPGDLVIHPNPQGVANLGQSHGTLRDLADPAVF